MTLYLKTIITSHEFFKLSCPEPFCSNKDFEEPVSNLLTKEEINKFNEENSKYLLSINPLTRWCPKPDCQGHSQYSGLKILSCDRCSTIFCEDCSQIYEAGHTCSKKSDLCLYVKESGARACPGCKILVEKQSGCTHMTCRCGTAFCMICGGFLNHRHDWFNCLIGFSRPSFLVILFVVLTGITFPFHFGFYIWRIGAYEKKSENGKDEGKCLECFLYLITFAMSPILMIIILLICPWYIMANPGGKSINDYLPRFKLFWLVKPFLYLAVYLLLVGLIVLVYACFNVYLTGRGVAALFRRLVK
jgi:hypothetical protein